MKKSSPLFCIFPLVHIRHSMVAEHSNESPNSADIRQILQTQQQIQDTLRQMQRDAQSQRRLSDDSTSTFYRAFLVLLIAVSLAFVLRPVLPNFNMADIVRAASQRHFDGAPTPNMPSTVGVPSAQSSTDIVFRNGMQLDYYPLNTSARSDFSLKRIVSVRITDSSGLESALAAISSTQLAALMLQHVVAIAPVFERSWRRGVVRVEAFLDSESRDTYTQRLMYQDAIAMLQVSNSACEHVVLNDTTIPAEPAFTLSSIHLFHCHSEFLTMPAALVGTADCQPGSQSSFCVSTRQPNDVPGFAKAADMMQEGERNVILDIAQLPNRPRPDSSLLNDKHESEWTNEECQDLPSMHQQYHRHLIEQVAHGPRWEALLPQSSVQVLSLDPPVFLIDNFLSAHEAQVMFESGQVRIAPSVVVGSSAEEALKWRTSQSTFFSNNETDMAAILEARALKLTGFSSIEGLQLVRYEKSQQYKFHHDWFRFDKGQGRAIQRDGQRAVTIFVYLNDVPIGLGGETAFWDVQNLRIRPRRYSAVFWYNIRADGREDERTLHSGQPMLGDQKWGMNFWLRDHRLVGPPVACP